MMPYIIILKVRKFHQPTPNRFSTARKKPVEGPVCNPPSLHRVKSLEVKCADTLVNKVFVHLASGDDLSHILPDRTEEKSVVLPYGFHTDWPPAANRICDLPSCLDENADQP